MVKLLRAPQPAVVGSAEFDQQLAAAGKLYRQAGVRYVYLLHGTFAGNDAFGLFGEIARFFPELGQSLRAMGKSTFDKLIGEAGNYTDDFAQRLASGLNAELSGGADFEIRQASALYEPSTDLTVRPASSLPEPIEVRRFHWSSENHHIARADAAIALLEELAGLELKSGERILLWCHSHAGNVLALLTNLLAAQAEDRRRFFRACRSYYRWPMLHSIDMNYWPHMQEMLDSDDCPFRNVPLDIATFGTPVRYGWDTDGCGRLMHFIHHQVCDESRSCVANFPPRSDDLLHGCCDFIQQLGIAGTDFPPGPVLWRSWLADWRLNFVLAPNLPRSRLLSRLRLGQRVHADGHNLLIDYGPQEGTIAHHILGHAVYTRQKWMAFHAREIANAFYSEDNPSDTQ